MGMISEFKAFAMRGNVVDMAIGVVIGGAFGAIVTALVSDVFMPVVGAITGGVNFKDQALVLGATEGVKDSGVKLGYGAVVDAIIKFVIIAFALFLVIKAMNAAKKKEEAKPAAPAAPPAQEVLLMEIRDLLKRNAKV